MRFFLVPLLVCLVAACGPSTPEGPVEVAIISDDGALVEEGLRLSPAGQHMRGATIEGLVSIDPSGQIIPAVAERWIVTEDGLSYIFRLRNSQWPDGEPITADDVRQSLRESLRQLRGTSLGLDLAKIDEIRAMTGRVVEIRLTSPMPDFLRLLAQPEMGLRHAGLGAGPMVVEGEVVDGTVTLAALAPQQRGLPSQENWGEVARGVVLHAMPANQAVEAFSSGEVDLVLNGQLASLPLADTGPLTRGTVRLDAALGVFGLLVRNNAGVLSEPELREALAMGIDRGTLMQPFSIGGWRASTWIVPTSLSGDQGPQEERWNSLSMEERREIAARRIAAWERAESRDATVSIALPPGPGSDMLFTRLSRDLAQIGVTARRAAEGESVDLELYDRLARYYSPRWYLNQFNCRLDLGLCSEEADDLVDQSIVELDAVEKARLLQAANRTMTGANIFIPLGAPVRWSLVRGDIRGFEENSWGMHPLFHLADPTI